jgi:hypothetical protein
MVPRWKQQLFGLFMVVLGVGFTAWGWYTAIFKGYYSIRASIVFPCFFVLGLALIVFPGYREERIARGEDISGLSGMRLPTRRWVAILVLGLVVGFCNCALLWSMSQ